MKKVIKKSILLFLLLSVALSVNCFAKSDFSYKLDASGNATITAYNGNKSELTIPSKIDGHKVVTIDYHAFDENRNNTNGHTIKKLVISEGITRIESFAFIECQNLQSVKLPQSLTYIGSMAFLRCTNLKSINIPSKVEALYGSTFQETGFTEFTIPKTLKSIQTREFASCKNLKKVIVKTCHFI